MKSPRSSPRRIIWMTSSNTCPIVSGKHLALTRLSFPGYHQVSPITELTPSKLLSSAQPLIGGTNNPAPGFRIATPSVIAGRSSGLLRYSGKRRPSALRNRTYCAKSATTLHRPFITPDSTTSPFVKPTSYSRELRELPAPSNCRQVM
jgi:hypothetical protein